jgi:ATP-dependent Clp protease ATP-binding subunit ClpC
MYERFTDRSRKVMQLANQEAQRFNHEYIGTEHILLGLIKEGSGVAANVLKNLDVDVRKIRLEVEKVVQSGPDAIHMGRLPQTPRAKKVIEYAIEEAHKLKHNYVGTEHLLLGLIREEEGVASQVLMNLGLRLETVREEVLNLLGRNPDRDNLVPLARGATKTSSLDSMGRDLTELARQGKLEPFVGRRDAIERALLVLGCREQGNLLLVGSPGVGKTALVRGLARLAAPADAPEVLRGRRVIEVNGGRIMLHTNNSLAPFFGTMRALAGEAHRAGNALLFIPDLFTCWDKVIIAAVVQEGIPIIAVATPETYRSVVACGEVFGRLFQAVTVEPPSREEAVDMVRAHRVRLEGEHRVVIAEEALFAAVDLSERHLEGALPGKAMRLLEQAAALARLRNAPPPPDMREMEARIEQLQQEKEAAVADQDFERAAHARDLEDTLRKERQRLLARWQEQFVPAAAVEARAVEDVVAKITGVQFRGG